jgi:D-arabinan exo alpha-(1,3)/(1,5)-arabinofuranosidase (non-reducing end)
MTRRLRRFVWLALFLLMLPAFGCTCEDDESSDSGSDDNADDDDEADDDDTDDDDDSLPVPLCPEDEMATGKVFLGQGNGDAARAVFFAVVDDYPECTDAHFGVALADQLRLYNVIDELLGYLFDPFDEEKGTVDAGAIVVDYLENLIEPMVAETSEQLAFCLEDESFEFELEWLPLELLGLEFLVYTGQYDHGDVLLQSAEFMLLQAAIDTILSVDLGFDFEIILDHATAWGGMDMISIVIDVIDMVIELLEDPDFPNFLALREEGYERMPRAGLGMGHAMDLYFQTIDEIRAEPQDESHDVTGYSDRNGNGTCDPDEFIHGVFYSLPSDLHLELQQVELALRNSYWDGTVLDIDQDNPNPFVLDQLNPILRYFGWPALIPALKIDFGDIYANPEPAGIRDPLTKILKAVAWLVEQLTSKQAGIPAGFTTRHPSAKNGGVPSGPAPVGLGTATDIAALPYQTLTARTMQLSSHDPAGGNEDGFFPPNHLYIDEHGEFVMFDQFGPGSIYRFQITHTWSFIYNMRVYVDDMEVPVIEGPLWMLFFLSAFEPFTPPLIGSMFNASGSNFSYVPIPFEKRCKITANLPPEFFSFTYVRYDADTPVGSFTGDEDYATLRSQFENVGQDPKPNVPAYTETGSQTLGAGESTNFLQVTGDGAVWRLYFDFDPLTQEAVEDLWLLAHWDGSWTPAVEAPVPEFFGSYFIEDAPRTLMMGHDGDRFYSYFPMPFWQNAVLKIENRGATPVEISWEVIVAEDAYADHAGYFTAVYNEENPVPVGQDYRIALRENASGKWIGLTHSMRGSGGGWYMEGDERYYVDGSNSPAVHGTGTEDYYNGGWYFLFGPFTHPMCGCVAQRSFPGYSQANAYRMHLADAVHYLDGARLGIEHGADNMAPGDHYSSVAYLYERNTPALVETDHLDVGDAAEEAAHGYSAPGSQETGQLTSFYEGEDDDIAVTDSGRVVEGESAFRVSIDPDNEGVLLRRRYDQYNPRQQATVLVDGVDTGTWYSAESSMTLRWAEDDFVLPPSATSGKSSVQITIQVEGEVPWTEFAYWVYSIVP